jgi:hypothetical protein
MSCTTGIDRCVCVYVCVCLCMYVCICVCVVPPEQDSELYYGDRQVRCKSGRDMQLYLYNISTSLSNLYVPNPPLLVTTNQPHHPLLSSLLFVYLFAPQEGTPCEARAGLTREKELGYVPVVLTSEAGSRTLEYA